MSLFVITWADKRDVYDCNEAVVYGAAAAFDLHYRLSKDGNLRVQVRGNLGQLVDMEKGVAGLHASSTGPYLVGT